MDKTSRCVRDLWPVNRKNSAAGAAILLFIAKLQLCNGDEEVVEFYKYFGRI